MQLNVSLMAGDGETVATHRSKKKSVRAVE